MLPKIFSLFVLLTFAFLGLIGEALGASENSTSCVKPFTHCHSQGATALPDKWRSSVLLAPFSQNGSDEVVNKLVRADVIADYSANAQLSRTYEVNTGKTIETLFVTSGSNKNRAEVFRLTELDDNKYQCEKIAETDKRFSRWLPPSAKWVRSKSDNQFFGQFNLRQIGATNSQSEDGLLPYLTGLWWKVPIELIKSEEGHKDVANWIVFSKETRLPFRIMNASRKVQYMLPLFGEYSISYFLDARAVSDTNLSSIKSNCMSGERVLGSSLDFSDAIPGLNFLPQLETSDVLPSFQHSFKSNALMTPISVEEMPFPTLIKYDYDNVRMYTTLFTDNGNPGSAAFLLKDKGRLSNCQGIDIGIHPTTLGAPQRGWMDKGGCEISSVMTAKGLQNTLVIGCPVKGDYPGGVRTFWMWYSAKGTPYSFMESEAELGIGTSLALADYYDWSQGNTKLVESDDENFCEKKIPIHQTNNMPAGCYGCHGGQPSNL